MPTFSKDEIKIAGQLQAVRNLCSFSQRYIPPTTVTKGHLNIHKP